MAAFLQNLIPVDLWIWALFFLLPAGIAFVGQLGLCLKSSRTSVRLIPLYVAGALLLCVALYRCTGFLASLIGGFVALLLLGTALFVLAASILGWLVFVHLSK